MEISGIFTIQKSTLFSVAYDGEVMEFKRLFDQWISDIAYLEAFFEENKADLNSKFYSSISIEEAIQRTRKQAVLFRNNFLQLIQNPNSEKLQFIFRPLNNSEYKLKSLSKEKSQADWLRIYAVRISENTYVISGGAIKLTQTMNERPHLQAELQKLEMTKRFLIENGLTDESDFGFVEFDY
ncbi:hypothetical protein [Runella sp.]|uniref:hypothetical protein n=1 Tax=Runella sp. TaxID=1960881 RepID=UPI003D0B18B9